MVLIGISVLITFLCLGVGGYLWWTEQQRASTSYIDELDDQSYLDVDLDTPERETYEKMAAAHREDPRRASNDMLSGALLRRAMAIVPYIERIEQDRPSVARLSNNSYIPASIVGELAEAEGLVEQEIKEVQAEAERLRQGWGRAVYAQAYDIVRRQRASAEAEGAAPPARKPAAAQAAAPQPAQPAQPPAGSPEGAPASAAAGAPKGPLSWSQTSEEVELAIAVPAATRPKDVRVQFGSLSCSVRVGAEAAPILSGALAHRVNADECTWSLVGEGEARKLMVTLFKQQPAQWGQLMAAP